MRSTLTLSLFLTGALAAACGPGRTAAATQPTPAAFDAQKSDAKAVALVDGLVAAVGGEAAWAGAKQISWQSKVILDGQTKLDAHHDWDRWNGRHRYHVVEVEGLDRAVAYEVFGTTAWALVDGATDVPRERVAQMKIEAQKRLTIDTYNLFMPFKLKDPGVILKYVEERPDDGATQGAPLTTDVIKVSFESGVGTTSGDVYYVVIDKATKLIRQIEWVEQGKQDDQRVGYKFESWTDVGGLKLSLKRQNIGYAGEVLEFVDVKVSEPNEELFVQQVR